MSEASTSGRALARAETSRLPGWVPWISGLLAGALLWALGAALNPARAAEDDPPGRVGRIVELQGGVSRFDHDEGRWGEAERNRPLTGGDRLSTAAGARVELRVGSTVLRLGANTELEVLRLDDERMVFQLHSGALALRVRSREVAAEIEIVTDEARLRPLRGGHFRFDRIDDTTFAGSWRGDLRVDDARDTVIGTGQRLELYMEAGDRRLRQAGSSLPDDAFAGWVLAADRREERSASARYVSPEMTGADELDRYGSWERHPEYGPIWYPAEVRVGWAPYRYGRWVWVRPWGWTWVDEAPWGFAPFHYGRWVWYRHRWCWVPGAYVARPVYSPAMVAWVGGAGWSVSVNVGGPSIGWVPLAPREVFVPYYRYTPVYLDRVNTSPRTPSHQPAPVSPTPPAHYINQRVQGAVTVVPRETLERRQPVHQAVVNVPEGRSAPVTSAPPAPVGVSPGPVAPVRVVPPPPSREGSAGNSGRVVEPSRGEAPAAGGGRSEIGVQPAPPRREPSSGEASGAPRERRDSRDPRDGRDTRERRDERDASRVRPLLPGPAAQPAQPSQPGQPAQPMRPSQPAPAAQPARPQPPAAGGNAAPPRAQPVAPQRGGESGGDDRKRPQPPRHTDKEREREASR